MSTTVYPGHRLPETPSVTLNSWLKSHYSMSSNLIQYVVGFVLCTFYETASKLHRALLHANGSIEPKVAWMTACGVLGVAVAVAAWFAFNLIMASSFIVHAVLHYLAVVIGLVGVGLGATGAFYFSREMEPNKRGGSSKRRDSGEEHHLQ